LAYIGLERADEDSEGRLSYLAIDKADFSQGAFMSSISAQNGDTISVHYIGKFPGGKVFDTSMKNEAVKSGLFNPARDYKPLQVVLGAHQVIGGFEEALVGMRVNESKEITLPPEKAYGKTGKHPMAGKTLQFRLLVTNIKRQ
jgi:FKBP-type peptidyl-prolyl cis-trans isomerase 2